MRIDIPDFTKASVLVVGDVMLDRYWRGDTNRISPEAPVPVVHIKKQENGVGGAANVAVNISALGGKAYLLGLVGNDEAAISLKGILKKANVNYNLPYVANTSTITKLRIIGQNQQLIRLDFEDEFTQCDFRELFTAYDSALQNTQLVILSDYGKGALHHSKEFIAKARKLNIPVLIDPKSKDFSIYAGATIVTPNQREFEAAVGTFDNDDELVIKARNLIEAHDFYAVLVTRGAHGMSLICKDQPPAHIPTRAREVYDVSGAGDTVIATLGSALACGKNIYEATILANAAAGVVVRKLGAATASPAELRRAMQRQQDPWAGIMEEEELLQEVADARSHGEKIVMTNGCFDILHAGHITYLEQAKSLGQRLIVAVNDDASVAKLKGPNRPINSLKQRMLVLSALRAVDWVVSFSEDTPERLIKRITPDVLVKGGDYQAEQIAGAKHVIDSGGEVKVLSFVEGFSTSNLINTIKK